MGIYGYCFRTENICGGITIFHSSIDLLLDGIIQLHFLDTGPTH